MSVQQSDVYTGDARGWDDEIDLGRYLLVAGAWWREIVAITLGLTLLAALAAWGWQSQQTPRYAASSDVVIARLNSQVALDERITTSEEIQQGGAAAWRASLLQLAQSPAIAQAVLEEVAGQIDDDWTTQSLVRRVEVSNPTGSDARTLSDLIRITVRTDDPQQSALIANTWAAHYIDHVNRVYGQVPGDTLTALQSELETAHAAYLDAEAALQSYIAGSQADRLQRQIDEKLALRSSFQQGRTWLLAAGTLSANQVISSTVQANLGGLELLYQQRALAQVQLNQARNLAAQLEQADPATSASNLLALQLLKAQVFARPVSGGNQPLTVDMSLNLPEPNASADALVADAQTMVSILEDFLVELDAEIAATAGNLLSDPNAALADQLGAEPLSLATAEATDASSSIEQTLSQLDQEIQELRGQLAAEEAAERQLIQQSDLTWTAYETLSNKQAELNLTRTVANSEVRLGAPAVPPVEPEPGRSLMLIIAAVGVASLIFALALALIANALGRKPLLARA